MNKKNTASAILLLTLIFSPFLSVYADTPTPDTTAPVITLVGDASVKITQGTTYTDAGATALDDVDGDITSTIVVVNPVDTNTPATYQVTYDVSDKAGNKATEVTRSVEVDAPLPPKTPQETILLRSGSTVIWQGNIDLPVSGTVDIPDKGGVTHSINADSVLAILYKASGSTDAFTISDLEYYSSFSSFYLKCITPKGGAEICDNWQYAVNDTTPGAGMDVTVLKGGESLGFYFGNPHKVTLDKSSVTVGDSVTATAFSYKYEDDTWIPLLGVTIGATIPNPSDPWNPTEVKVATVDNTGSATVTLSDPATYTIGIKEDFYFPSYVLIVNPNTGGGGGTPVKTFGISQAVTYLTSKQNVSGAFGDMLYTDWSAIALAAAGSSAKQNVANYLNSTSLVSAVVTDNERHAMALMALGINPYTGTNTDYIHKITASFDGTQFGDSSLVNDDIFALIVLHNAGYSASDDLITKDVLYVIGQQQSDGSWGSVDMTAAGIQALRDFSSVPGVSTAISKGELYLTANQSSDGGFGNSSSTSWALPALAGNGALASQMAKADAYLATQQQSDGGLEPVTDPLDTRVWSTSYAIVGALHIPWSSIMQSFSKPVVQSGGGGEVKITISSPVVPVVKKDVLPDPVKPVVTTDPTPVKIVPTIVTLKKHKIKTPTEKAHAIPQIPEVTSSLTASTVGAEGEHSLPYTVIHAISTAIISPFVWLWGKLGF